MTPSEKLVYELCRESFLSLWSYANPLRAPGKELCDVLVVCDPDVVLFSIKDIEFGDSGDPSVDHERWIRRAINESGRQLYGAERWIRSNSPVLRSDGEVGLPFPSDPNTHTVAVALGGRGKPFYHEGDFGKGYVHVLDEQALLILLRELDTITDFVRFLSDKEQAIRDGFRPMIVGGDEDLLAVYLQNGRAFSPQMVGATAVMIEGPLWDSFANSEQYRRKKEADQGSYAWDRMIEYVAQHAISGTLEPGSSLTDAELALRDMAREDRVGRRMLAQAFKEFHLRNDLRCRTFASPSGVCYVFLTRPQGFPREARKAELANRCFVARGRNPTGCVKVIGIATEEYEEGQGFSFDLGRLDMPTWTAEHEAAAAAMQDELAYFQHPRITEVSEDEYPAAQSDAGGGTQSEADSGSEDTGADHHALPER